MRIDLTEIALVIGRKNSGKSVLVEHLLTGMEQFVVIDPNGEHGPPGAKAVTSPVEVLRQWVDGNRRLVVRDAPMTDEKLVQYLRAFGQLRDAYLVIDEAHNFMSAHSAPDELVEIAKWHCTHNDCGLVLGFHQAKECYDKIFTHADRYFIFSYGQHLDSKLKSSNIPDVARVTRIDPESYRFLYYEDVVGAEGSVRGPVPLPDHLS